MVKYTSYMCSNSKNFFSDRENVDHAKKEANPPTTANSEGHKNQQRPSLISIFTGTGTAATSHSHFGSVVQMDSRSASGVFGTPSDTLSSHTLHPQKEMSSSTSGATTTRESDSIQSNDNTAFEQRTTTTVPSSISSNVLTTSGGIFKHHGPKLRFVSSVEFKHSSGETSTTPLSPESLDESTGSDRQKHKFQRNKTSSRKTFRLRRARQSQMESSPVSTITTEKSEVTPFTKSEVSWDSVSQTSSTSGYKENNSLQTGIFSPDGSLGSASQNSLLMLFETQEEDTFI